MVDQEKLQRLESELVSAVDEAGRSLQGTKGGRMSETRDDDGPRLETFVELLRGISEFPQEEAVQCLALILGASRNGCEFHEREVAALLRVWQGAATDLSLLECVARGFMEVSEKDGEAFFWLSESGKQEAMKLVAAIKGTSQ